MKDKHTIIYFLTVMIFTSCARYSTTQQNIKKANDAMTPPPVTKILEELKVDASQTKTSETPGSIPLSEFLNAKTTTEVQSVNPWYQRTLEWSRVYRDIAEGERDVRNFKLSEKFSKQSLAWAHRSLQIKQLPTMGANVKVQIWLDQLQIPNLPETSSYFVAQDAFQKIVLARDALGKTQNRACLIVRGVPLILALAYLDLSIDLYQQKKFSKSLYKIQTAMAPLENLESEDKKCATVLPDEDTTETVN